MNTAINEEIRLNDLESSNYLAASAAQKPAEIECPPDKGKDDPLSKDQYRSLNVLGEPNKKIEAMDKDM